MNITDYVMKHQGCSLVDIIDNVDNHYANPRRSIPHIIREGWVENITLDGNKWPYEVYLSR